MFCCPAQVTLTATVTQLAKLRAQLRAACCVYTQYVLFHRPITACAPDNNTLPTALNFWERAVQFSVCCSRCCSHARLDHSATPNYLFCVGPSFFVYAVHTSCMQQLNQLMPCLGNHCSLFAARNVIQAHHALCKLLGAVCRRCCQAITGKNQASVIADATIRQFSSNHQDSAHQACQARTWQPSTSLVHVHG
jgi:hypothetical protein